MVREIMGGLVCVDEVIIKRGKWRDSQVGGKGAGGLLL